MSGNPRFCSDCDILTHAFWDAFFRSPPQFTRSFSGMVCPFSTFLGLHSSGKDHLQRTQSWARTDKYQKSYIIFSIAVFCWRTRYSSVNNHRNPIGLFIFENSMIFFARARKTALTFLKNKNFTSGQKHRERIGNGFPKHPKTSKTDQNSQNYPKKTRGGH